MKDEIILIGPVGAGKSTLGRLVADRIGVPQRSMDGLRWRYYKEVGYDEGLADWMRDRGLILALYWYWKPFDVYGVERLLADHRDCVFDLGAGHSVYENDELMARARRALAPYRNVVLVLPSPDLDESVRLLNEWNGGFVANGFDFNEHFVKHPSNHELATHVVYTQGKTPETTRDEILRLAGH